MVRGKRVVVDSLSCQSELKPGETAKLGGLWRKNKDHVWIVGTEAEEVVGGAVERRSDWSD
jgi:hypothetical protein